MPYITTSDYAPGCYIIVETGYSETDEDHTRLIQCDWDYPSLASAIGFIPCDCKYAQLTDGTVDCGCGKTASQMIAEAQEYLDSHLDEEFEALIDYF